MQTHGTLPEISLRRDLGTLSVETQVRVVLKSLVPPRPVHMWARLWTLGTKVPTVFYGEKVCGSFPWFWFRCVCTGKGH